MGTDLRKLDYRMFLLWTHLHTSNTGPRPHLQWCSVLQILDEAWYVWSIQADPDPSRSCSENSICYHTWHLQEPSNQNGRLQFPIDVSMPDDRNLPQLHKLLYPCIHGQHIHILMNNHRSWETLGLSLLLTMWQSVRGWPPHSKSVLEFFQLWPLAPLEFFGLQAPSSPRSTSEFFSHWPPSSNPQHCCVLLPPQCLAQYLLWMQLQDFHLLQRWLGDLFWLPHPPIQTPLQCSSDTVGVVGEMEWC